MAVSKPLSSVTVPHSQLPPPHPAQSIVKMLALAWFLMLSPPERDRLLKILRWVADVFSGPVQHWPLDFGRPLSEAEPVIASNRSAAVWIARLADLLEAFKDSLPG